MFAMSLDEMLDLPLGSAVVLRDEATMTEMIKAGHGLQPLECQIDQMIHVREQSGLADWVMLHLINPLPDSADLWQVSMFVQDKVDYRLHYLPEDFNPALRSEVVDRGDLWMFQEPANPNNFRYTELEFSDEIPYGDDIVFKKKGFTLYCEAEAQPAISAVAHPMFASVTEYLAENTDSPELMIFELGGADPNSGRDSGGLIRLLLGRMLGPNDFDILPA